MATRDKVLQTAERLFAEKGFAAVSIKDITNAAGVNLAAVTYHFGNKEKLFTAVFMRKLDFMSKTGVNIVQSSKKPVDKLKALLEMYAMQILHKDPALRIYYAELLSGSMHLPRSISDVMNLRNRLFIQIVKEGIKAGAFRRCDLECAAWNFFGMLTPYILYEPLVSPSGRLAPYPVPYVKRIVEAAIDVFLNGISAGRARPMKGRR
jgi:TetR/AcrR family transcriptional regulator